MESNDSSLSTTSSGATLNSWKYKHYFEILEEGEKNIIMVELTGEGRACIQ